MTTDPDPFDEFKGDHPWFGTGTVLLTALDGYPITDADPYAAEQLRLADWLAADFDVRPFRKAGGPQRQAVQPHTAALCALDVQQRGALVRALLVRVAYHGAAWNLGSLPRNERGGIDWKALQLSWQETNAIGPVPLETWSSEDWTASLGFLLVALLDAGVPIDGLLLTELVRADRFAARRPTSPSYLSWRHLTYRPLLPHARRLAKAGGFTPVQLVVAESHFGVLPAAHNPLRVPLRRADEWEGKVLASLLALPAEQALLWVPVVDAAQEAHRRSRSAPPPAFTAAAQAALAARGPDAYRAFVLSSLRAYAAYGEHGAPSPSVGSVRGFVWAAAHVLDEEVAGELAATARRAERSDALVVNACLLVLSQEADTDRAFRHLVPLRLRFKKRGSRQRVDTLLLPLAEAQGLTLEDLTDQTLPDFGLTDGAKQIQIGDAVAAIRADDRSVSVAWIRADGKRLKSAPTPVRREHPDEVKAVTAEAKQMRKALTEQRARIEGFYLKARALPAPAWRRTTLDHGLAATIARKLVWQVHGGDAARSVLWTKAGFIDAQGAPAAAPSDETTITLWHPVHADEAELSAWRERLAERQLVQPFRQVYRARYLLTEAERNATRCTRFDGHVVRQHVFGQLAGQRGWAMEYSGYGGDGTGPSTRALLPWNLRAELDAEPVDNRSVGRWEYVELRPLAFRRGSVRDYDRPEEPLVPLADVPSLVFSETLRDVELFVAKASVGAETQPRVPGDVFYDYWERYHFGELEERSQTRRAVIEKLLPHLPHADRFTVDGRFLRVEGTRGAYRIHLGSASAQTADGRHLALAPAPVPADERLFLPFDDDPILTLVLSKAALLAADDRIEDPEVLAQLG